MTAVPAFHDAYAATAKRQLEALAGRPLSEREIDRLVAVAEEREAAGDRPAVIANTYTNTRSPVRLARVASWMRCRERGAPIVTGHGTLFKPHGEHRSVVGEFVQALLDTRAVVKEQMFDLIRAGRALDDPEVKAKDQAQKIYKLLANAYFGATGEQGFHFFDPIIGPAITYCGQLETSATLWTFEAFLGGNLWLGDADEMARHAAECALHCDGADPAEWGLVSPDDADLVDLLVRASASGWDSRAAAEELVTRLPGSVKLALAYRGRPYDFLGSERAMALLDAAVGGEIREADPKSLAKHHPEGKAALEELWGGLRLWVAVPWLPGDLPRRASTMRRRVVILCDTDSTFLHLGPWMDWVRTRYDLTACTAEERLTALNSIVYVLRLLSDDVMGRLTAHLQVPEDRRWLINYKSEFVIARMMLTGGKKHYAALNTHQEGVFLPKGGKIDIKGLALKKTNVAPSTGKFFMKSIEDRVLRPPAVDRAALIRDVVDLEKRVRASLAAGDTEYTTPAVLGRLESYANQWAMPVVRGAAAWNAAVPETPVRAGDRVNLFRLRIGTDAAELAGEIARWPEGSPEAAALLALVDNFFGPGAPEGLVTNGLNWLAVPKGVARLPAWAVSLTDADAAAQANVAPIFPVLEAVGIKLLRLPTPETYSNVLPL